MLTVFLLQNLHFAINIFVTMVMSWCFWLYWDVWITRRSSRVALKFTGFALLAISFLAGAASLETSLFANEFINESLRSNILVGTRMAGYLFLAVGVYLDPILSHPKLAKEKEQKENKQEKAKEMKESAAFMLPLAGMGIPLYILGYFSLPVLAATVGIIYLYKATYGYEHHLRRLSFAFFGLSLYEFLSLRELFTSSTNIAVHDLVAPFAPLWYITNFVLLISMLVLGRWVFSYLLKRIETQLYIFFSVAVLVISLVSAVTYTYFLLGNVQKESLEQLEVSAKVLDYSLETKKEALQADARVLSEDQDVIDAVREDQRIRLSEIATDYLVNRKLRSLVIVDQNGQVLARGEDPERVGGSVSGSSLFQRGIEGRTVASVTSQEGVLGPDVYLSAVSPVSSGDEILGVVIASFAVDNAFVDGINRTTGLMASIYGGSNISATTITAEDGHNRRVGITESNQEIVDKVLRDGELYLGENSFLNTPYFAAYLPLKDIDEVPVGMIFVGEPEVAVLTTAGRSIQGTFVFSAILWILASIPSYLIAVYISKQLR